MSSDDVELELLKLKKMLRKASAIESSKRVESKIDYRSILMDRLTERARELLRCAEAQYPNEAKNIIEALGRLIESGKIEGSIDEYSLNEVFLNFGLNVRFPTKIQYVRKGEKKSLSDLLKESN
ncbi:MAG: DNA-binding protein [Candidatus Methanomethylicia archaeon]